MDIVYPLGIGSVWDNNEIRYSLRSVEENFRDVRNVWIIGQCPAWLTNIRHLAVNDICGIPSKNTYNKLRSVCLEPDLSENFLLMNDDFYILQPISVKDFPYYYKGQLPSAIRKSRLMAIESSKNTVEFLQKRKLSMLDYRVHCPMAFNKEKFLNMPITENEHGIVNTRAVYGNYYQVGGIRQDEILVPACRDLEQLKKRLSDKPFFSLLSLAGRDWRVRQYLKTRWPNPSKYEK